MTALQFQELETIDSLPERFLKEAEGKCRKKWMGAYDYSPVLQHPLDQVEFWRLAINKRLGHRVSSQKLVQQGRKARIQEFTKRLTFWQMITQRETSLAEFREICQEHTEHRESFVRDLAVAIFRKKTQIRNKKRNTSSAFKIKEELQDLSNTHLGQTTQEILQWSFPLIPKEIMLNALLKQQYKSIYARE